MNQNEQKAPSPVHFFETINAFQKTEGLNAAIHLDVFTVIDQGMHTPAEIARQCEASERGIRILCDFLTMNGFLSKTGNSYSLTRDSAVFLSKRSPGYLAGAVDFVLNPVLRQNFSDLITAVRAGGRKDEQSALDAENPIWVQFARSMAPIMSIPAEIIAKILGSEKGEKWKVLDIAAGHGMFGITIAKFNPNATIHAVDWKNVLQVAKENAAKMGVAERYEPLPGSAFEVSFGTDYDLVLLTNFLHHFDVSTCENFLRKVHAALKPGGRVATFEFVPNEDRVSPPNPASFSLVMLAFTPGGDAYTFSEFDRMFKNAGFSSNQQLPVIPEMNSLIISTK